MSARRELNVFLSGMREITESVATAKKIARKIGELGIQISRDRTASGYGRRGRLPRYSRSYRKQKRMMISGRWRMPRGSRADSEWRARKVNDRGRLTGETFGSMVAVSPRVDKRQHSLDLFITLTTNSARTKRRIEYLKRMGYDILGLSSPSSARGKKERRLILRETKKLVKGSARAKGVVLEDE